VNAQNPQSGAAFLRMLQELPTAILRIRTRRQRRQAVMALGAELSKLYAAAQFAFPSGNLRTNVALEVRTIPLLPTDQTHWNISCEHWVGLHEMLQRVATRPDLFVGSGDPSRVNDFFPWATANLWSACTAASLQVTDPGF
jgi:hypothetical protein